jgi:hypothetical protein
MLTDQLERIRALPGGGSCDEIMAAWQQAAFSDAHDHSLQRYFSHQLHGVARLAASGRLAAGASLALTDYLLACYPGIPAELSAPAFYRCHRVRQLEPEISALESRLAAVNEFSPLLLYFGEMRAGATFTYGALFYFEQLVASLSDLPIAALPDLLIQLNFNNLAYFASIVKTFETRLRQPNLPMGIIWLRREKARIAAIPENARLVYHPDWPSLKTMLLAWLDEQIELEPVMPAPVPKLALNLSVAQLACLLRLAYDEGLFKETNLTAILHFFTDHFAAKKQHTISPGGLSKEYYGSGQVTAAVLRDKLQKMIARLNRNFFPG